MAADEKWYFTKEQLANTPSRKCGYDADKELSCRQQAANFIQDMGQRLQVTQLCINTAIVYMHRFYMFHSFSRFHRNAIASAALFLAAKVEEQPRKLEHVIKVAQICLHREQPPMDIKSEAYAEHSHDLVMNENILLQTLGFDVAIDHPHTHVVKCCHLVKDTISLNVMCFLGLFPPANWGPNRCRLFQNAASKDLAQTSYFMASNSLHLTTMCLQYKPTVVACFCIHLACKWSNWEIPQSNEGRPWFWYVDRSVTQELLEQLTDEFLAIFEKCPSRLKKKIISISSNQNQNQSQNPMLNIPPEMERRSKGVEGTTCFGPISSIVPPQAIASSSSSEDIKKKMELSQRPPPDYKKPHSSHHLRLEGHNTNVVKTSCVFAPPQRTHPQHNLHAMGGTGRMPSAAPHQPQPHQAMVQPHRTRLPPHQLPRNGSYHNTEQNHGSFNKKYERPPSSIGHSNSGAEKVQCLPTSNNSSSVPVLPPPPSEPIPSNFVPPLGSVTLSTRPSFPLPPMPTQPLPPMLNTDPVSVPPSFPSVVSHKPLLDIPIISPVPTFPETTPVFLQAVKLPTVSQSPKPKTPPPRVKPERSIFSPEKTTPPPIDTSNSDLKPELTSPSAVNPPLTPGKSARNRNSSSSSEAELVPVTPKIEEVSGFELLGKGETSIKLPGRIPDLIQPIKDQARETVIPKEEKPPDLIKSFPEQNYIPEDHNSKEHKKKKKKHKEGKHKEKHKDKHKHKHKNRDPEPIVITIPKEKITFSQPPPDQSLKIKIAKDKIAPSPALKIKIPKDKIKESRKRERSEERTPGLPTKHHRPNGTTLQVGLESAGRH